MSARRRVSTAVALTVLLAVGLLGCTSTDDPTPAPGPSDPATETAVEAAASDWETASPAAHGFDPAALEDLAAEAERKSSVCLVVAHEGVLVGEWYWHDMTANSPREVFSVTKSVTSTLVGIAQADGDLSIDDPASTYIPEWRGTPSARVTVRNLLSNDSGRFWNPTSDYTDLLAAEDRSAYAVGLPQQSRPGKVWAYNNAAIQTLDRVIAEATGEVTAEFAEERLFEPLGMADTRMTQDASRQSTNAFFGLNSTCRDLARFGALFAQDGVWDDEQIVPASWVRDATGASSQRLNASYGLLWWVNRRGPLRGPFNSGDPQAPPDVTAVGQMIPGAPADLFAALGFAGQVVLVDPRSETVVVRLGGLAGDGEADYRATDAARVVTEALEPRSAR